MKAADGLFLGKTNAPEGGYYGGTDNHIYGPTHNPWKKGHTPGGSSGGAGAAIAAGLGPLAEGADGAGSVRIPAAMNGVVGFKPSLGRSPHSLLQGRFYTCIFHGPLTRTVADAALMLNVIPGESDTDPLSLPDPTVDYLDEVNRPIEGWKIAFSPDLGLDVAVDPEVLSVCREALAAFEAAGATVVDATPDFGGNPEEPMWNGVWIPAYASEYDFFPNWETQRGKLDDDLIELIRNAATTTVAEFAWADNFRGAMYDRFAAFMRDFDLLVTPTLAVPTFPFTLPTAPGLENEPLRRRILGWLLTYPFNMATNPAIAVPAGFTSDGRPISLQIVGRFHADGDVLAAAARFEEQRPWADVHPSVPFVD